jgi:hypothetical protein
MGRKVLDFNHSAIQNHQEPLTAGRWALNLPPVDPPHRDEKADIAELVDHHPDRPPMSLADSA